MSCNGHSRNTRTEAAGIYCTDTIQLIGRDLDNGSINRDEAFLYKTYALFDYGKLPDRYKSHCAIKGATLIIREIKREYGALSEETREKISRYLFPAAKGKKKQ